MPDTIRRLAVRALRKLRNDLTRRSTRIGDHGELPSGPTQDPQSAVTAQGEQNPSSAAAQTMELIRRAHDCGDWEGVLRLAQSFGAARPDGRLPVGPLAHRSRAYLELGRLAEAAVSLREVVAAHSQSHWAYAELARLALRAGDWEQALADLEMGIAGKPHEPALYEHLWSLLRDRRYPSHIEARYRERIGRQPPDASACAMLAGVYALQGRQREAAELFDRARQGGLDALWVHLRRIDALVDGRDIAQAESELQRLFPDSAQERERLAALAQRAGRFEQALARWRALQALGDESLDQPLGEIKALVELGRTAEAFDALARIAARWPDSGAAERETARLYCRLKRWPEALEALDLALAKIPKNRWLSATRGDVLLALGRLAEARESFERFAQQHPHLHLGLLGLARVARLSGDPKGCLIYCGELIERFPGLAPGYLEAEQAYIDLGQSDRANETFLARPGSAVVAVQPRSARPPEIPLELQLPPLAGNGNDYGFIEEQVRRFRESGERYRLGVSIVIPVYNRQDMLAKTLAALTHQTYPRELIEVVVADDGSSDTIGTVIEKYRPLLDLKYVRQEDLGFRLAAVRNLGMRAARHDYFIVIDCDMLPLPALVESYMRWFHVSSQVALIGHRRFVCADHLSDDAILADVGCILDLPDIERETSGTLAPAWDWRLRICEQTDWKKTQLWAFVGFVGASLAHTREAVERVGDWDEEFQAWGSEDNEMGYRLFNAGYYFVPVMEAVGLHQEPPGEENETNRAQGLAVTRPLLAEKCPIPNYRRYEPGRVYAVPKVSIYIPAYNAEAYIAQAVDSALAQTYTDLEVCICDDGSTDRTLDVLTERYSGNPRVHWMTQTRGGIGKASNAAVRMCRGMYIGQLDADDMLKPEAVATFSRPLDCKPVGCVYGVAEIVGADGTFARLTHSREFSREALICAMFVSPFRMFRKRDWLRTAGFAEDLESAVDYDMYLKLAEVCDFLFLPEVHYRYRWHGQNTSVAGRRTQERNHVLVINRALQRLGLERWEAVPDGSHDRRSVRIQERQAMSPGRAA